MAATSTLTRVRVSWSCHVRHNEIAECIAAPINGRRLVRFADGACMVLEPHEWEAA